MSSHEQEAVEKREYMNPDAQPWTRRDEIKQRLGNCRRMLVFALLALRYDSAVFACVFLNAVRSEGDGVIARIVTRGVRVDGIEKNIPN